MMGCDILLVDDHVMIIDALKTMIELRKEFVVKATAYDGLEALEMLRNGLKVDIVISDIRMQPLDGIELCKIIKQEFKHIKVLMLTIYDHDNVVNLALDAAADGYLLKSAGKEVFFDALKIICTEGQFYDENISRILVEKLKSKKG